MKDDKTDKLKLILSLIVLVAVLGSLYNIPTDLTNQIIEWLVSIFISSVFSILAGSLVEAFTGDMLKKLFLNIHITDDVTISISLFTIATFLVKFWLFG